MADHTDELGTLRERAYGPGADIHDDPRALRRLRELEDAELARSALGAVADDTAAPVAVAPHVEPEDHPTDDPTEAPVVAAVPTPWWRTRTTLLWLVALAASVTVAIAATAWVVQDRASVVAVLGVDDESEWPESFFGARQQGAMLFDGFLGLTVISQADSWLAGENGACLYVLETTTQAPAMSTAGCSAGAFPPTAGLVVSERAPDELRSRFADGTGLQFVLEGDEVYVYSDAP